MNAIKMLRELADQELVSDGGRWPVNPESGAPLCDRCESDATRYAMPSPHSCVFFCSDCSEEDELIDSEWQRSPATRMPLVSEAMTDDIKARVRAGESIKSIAADLGLSESAVYMRLRRAWSIGRQAAGAGRHTHDLSDTRLAGLSSLQRWTYPIVLDDRARPAADRPLGAILQSATAAQAVILSNLADLRATVAGCPCAKSIGQVCRPVWPQTK